MKSLGNLLNNFGEGLLIIIFILAVLFFFLIPGIGALLIANLFTRRSEDEKTYRYFRQLLALQFLLASLGFGIYQLIC
jgi:hypothetical protein